MTHVKLSAPGLVILAIILGACANTGTSQQTLIAHDMAMSTDRAIMAATATADIAQMLSTLDTSQLRMSRAEEQRGRIISTLEARDIVVEFASMIPDQDNGTSVAMLPVATPTINPSQTLRAGAAAIPTDGTSIPTDVPVTPFQQSPTPTPTSPVPATLVAATNLTNVVTATNVRDDDCAADITSQFSTTTESIYVVATANDIEPGTRLSSQWQRGSGEQLAIFDFTPDFAIDDECIWFFATADDFPFNAGSYSVTLLVNGEVASSPIPFEISVPVTPNAAVLPGSTATNSP